jgi:hypothetical protein
MRDFSFSELTDTGAKVKLTYENSELRQHIEISLDAEDLAVADLINAYQRFLGALGVNIPENHELGFVLTNEEDEDDDNDDNDDDDGDDDGDGDKKRSSDKKDKKDKQDK